MNYPQIAKVYAELKAKEAEYEALRVEALQEMQKAGINKEETNYGTFTVANKVSYTYTDKVKALEEKVKLAKVKEEQKGLATERVTTYLRFSPIKD